MTQPPDTPPQAPNDPAHMTLAQRGEELARRAKAHMAGVKGHTWRDDRDGYVCLQIAQGSEARLPASAPASDEDLALALKDGKSTDWGEERSLHAELIRWLCADPVARPLIPHTGIGIIGARIKREVNLRFADVPFPLRLIGCSIEGDMVLVHASVAFLSLQGSTCKSIRADGLVVRGGVLLRHGFHATGEISLLFATIGGNLDCSGGRFENPLAVNNTKAFALFADGLDVKGVVFLNDRRYLKDGVEVREHFYATGAVRLRGAAIGGDVECIGSKFDNPRASRAPNARSLDAEGAHIGGALVARDGCEFGGYVSLVHASVGAMQLLGNNLLAGHTIDLRQAHVGVLLDEKTSWPEFGRLLAQGFRYDAIDSEAPHTAEDRLAWLGRMPADKFRPQPYTHLASILRARGDRAGAVRVLIKREWEALRIEKRWSKRAWGWLKGHGLAFGFKPERALYGIVALWLLGSALFFVGFRFDLIVPTKADAFIATAAPRSPPIAVTPRPQVNAPVLPPPAIPTLIAAPAVVTAPNALAATPTQASAYPTAQTTAQDAAPVAVRPAPALRPGYPRFWAMIYSLDALAPFIDLMQDGYYIPRSDTPWGMALLAYLSWIHIPMGWLLFTFFVASVTGLVKPADN